MGAGFEPSLRWQRCPTLDALQNVVKSMGWIRDFYPALRFVAFGRNLTCWLSARA